MKERDESEENSILAEISQGFRERRTRCGTLTEQNRKSSARMEFDHSQ